MIVTIFQDIRKNINDNHGLFNRFEEIFDFEKDKLGVSDHFNENGVEFHHIISKIISPPTIYF